MPPLKTRRQRLTAIRSDLAELAVEVELIRVERVLARKNFLAATRFIVM